MSKPKILGFINSLILNATRILKDEEYQRRIWFKHEGPEVSSYTETNVYFLNTCEKIFQDTAAEEQLGEETYGMLKKLYQLVDEHFESVDERIDSDLIQEDELLNDPHWHDIQTLAEKLEEKLEEFVMRHTDE